MLGLIARFTHGNPWLHECVNLLVQRALGRHSEQGIHRYNDHIARNVSDVIALFEKAARLNDGDQCAPDWSRLSIPDEKNVLKIESDFSDAMKKLIPWESIMRQIERDAA